jgi:hypothetical protein
MEKSTRKGFVLGLMAIGVLAVAVGVAWAVSSNGPYYALPSWDQKLPAATRFVVLTDWASQAVLDRETGLIWEQAPGGTLDFWQNAMGTCLRKDVGGRRGWRLPSIAELASLIDPSNSTEPTLPAGHPFVNVSDFYWSSTLVRDPLNPNHAWGVGFDSLPNPSGVFTNGVIAFGAIAPRSSPTTAKSWCVRGPMNGEAY